MADRIPSVTEAARKAAAAYKENQQAAKDAAKDAPPAPAPNP